MRPIELTFSGLRSYRDTATIDFSALDLFAVIGDTGAGKSTIIEALSLALYAKKSWTGGPAGLADMIADGVNTMRVELRFHADEHDWVVTRARHRNASGPIDKLTSPTGGGPNVDGARQVNDRVKQLVGLDHDQFTRAVVLPQGRFDLLLRATEKQRTEILSSILGLGDIALTRQRVETVRDEWIPHAVEMQVRRSHQPADPAGERAARAWAHGAESKLAVLTAACDVAVEADRQVVHLGQARERLAHAITAVPAGPLDPAAELADLHGRAAALHIERQQAATAADEADQARAAIDLQATTVRAGFATRDEMIAARGALAGVAQAVDKDADRVATVERELAAHDASVPPDDVDPALVAADQAAGDLVTSAAAQFTAAEQRHGDATRAWRAMAESRILAVSARAAVAAAEAPMSVLDDVVAAAEAALVAADQRSAEAGATERAALVAGAAARAAVGCSAGDDCPVCAQPLPAGFVPPAAPDDAAVAHARQLAEDEARRCRGECDAAARSRADAERALVEARNQLAAAIETQHRRDHEARGLGLDDGAADETTGLAPFVEAMTAAGAELDAARQRQEATARELAAASARLDEARRSHAALGTRLRADLAAARATSSEHAAVVARLPAPWRPALTRAAVDGALVRLDDALDALDGLADEREMARQAASDGHARMAAVDLLLSTELAVPLARVVAAANRRAAALRAVVAACVLAGGADLAAPDNLDDADLAGDLDAIAALTLSARSHIERGPVILAAAERDRAGLDRSHDEASRSLAAALADAGVADIGSLHAALGGTESDLRAADAAVVSAEAALAEVARIDTIRDVLDPFVANLKVLAVALRDQHFVAHLVRARETELLAEATRRLKDITGGRFGFAAGFGVVSVASGEVRTPDTLSGGERFQAALALALGLVEIATRGGGKLDAVFVDEGFGSLDSGALDTALDTLGKVAVGGKMVALISHLRPVAEYVDTVLHVTRDDVLGSRIEVLDSEAREQLLADDIRSGLTA